VPLATKEDTAAVSKPKNLAHPLKVGQRLVYDDGRRSTGKVVAADSLSMHVLFDDKIEPTLVRFDDPQWMDYITFDQ